MPRNLEFVLLAVAVVLVGRSAQAQDAVRPDTVVIFDESTADSLHRIDFSNGDTLRMYGLTEIVVSSGQDRTTNASTVQKVSLAQIARSDAVSISGVARLIPAAHVQTNSRGETHVYLRNSGERQVAFFFDGALLNVPWDYRVDLGLIPSSAVGGITVAKGVPSVLFGTNVIGGAVNLTSRSVENEGSHRELSVHGGLPQSGQITGTFMQRKNRLHLTASAGYAYDAGDALSKDAVLEYSQIGDDIRTNSSRRLANLFGQLQYGFSDDAALSVTVLHIDGEKGVAPEGHLNPSFDRVRFWRYPLWRHSMLLVNASFPAWTGRLKGVVWGTHARQDIDRYESALFARVAERQQNQDWAGGSRVIWSLPAGGGTVRFAGNALTSRHSQREIGLGDDVQAVQERSSGEFRLYFHQHILSVGAEYDGTVLPRLNLLLGASLDGAATPLSGDKPHRDAFVDYAVTSGIAFRARPSLVLRASAGRKVRFPTMRELFGEAINRFVVNPDLEPETAYVLEVGSSVDRGQVDTDVTIFVNQTIGTIDQETLADGRRRRINLDESRTFGIEGSGSYRTDGGWGFYGHATWLHTRGREDGIWRPVPERPNVLGSGTLSYDLRNGISLLGELIYIGDAYSMDEAGAFVPLPTSLALNVRLSYRRFISSSTHILTELFIRADNLTDQLTMPQLGLPAAGREITAGVNLSF